MKILSANRIAPDGTPRSAASHLGLFCLPMSHKRDARLKLVNVILYVHLAALLMVRRVVSRIKYL